MGGRMVRGGAEITGASGERHEMRAATFQHVLCPEKNAFPPFGFFKWYTNSTGARTSEWRSRRQGMAAPHLSNSRDRHSGSIIATLVECLEVGSSPFRPSICSITDAQSQTLRDTSSPLAARHQLQPSSCAAAAAQPPHAPAAPSSDSPSAQA